MDSDSAPSPAFKKRVKGIRPSGSTSSLRSLAASPSTAAPVDAELPDEEEGTPVIRRTKKSAAAKVKDREGGSKIKGRLSFGAAAGDEEDEEPTFVKRSIDSPSSASSRRLLRPSALAAASAGASDVPTSLDQASISSTPTLARSTSLYSKEHLNELKAATLSTPRSANGAGSEFDDLTLSKFGSRAADGDDPAIPTTQAIAEAKKRRERMRAEGVPDGAGDGFIGLEVGFASKRGESRLVREEDEIGDGDEDLADYTGASERVPLGKKANREAADRMRSGMIEMIQDVADEGEEGDDAESREWEEAQIRRGEGRRVVTNEKSSKRPYKPTPIPRTGNLPSLPLVTSRLAHSLSDLTASLSLDSTTLSHFEREKAELEAQEAELRKEVEGTERKREWFEGMRGEMDIVGGFLEEKFPLLEKIEATSLSIASERASLISSRRFADDSDDVSLFTGASTHTIYPPPPTAEELGDAMETDEFGRARQDDQRPPPRSEARAMRRAAREARLAARRAAASATEDDGSYTDDELDPSTSADLSSALAELRTSLTDLFSDVKAANFRDPNLGIRKRFEEWRESYRGEYESAFGGLALVGVWEFWGRVEGVGAEIDHQERPDRPNKGLETYHWHQSLTSYGHSAPKPIRPSSSSQHSDASEDEDDNDESADLINAFVTSTLIPRLSKLARVTYDPLSVRATTRALGVVDEVSYCVDKGSEKFETLIQSHVLRIQHLITLSQSLLAPHLALLASPSLAFDPSTFTARSAFLSRQVKLLQQSLRWRRFARSLRIPASAEGVGAGLLFDELLERELVAKVILPLVEASWATGGEEMGAKVIAMLPKDGNPALRRRLEGIRE